MNTMTRWIVGIGAALASTAALAAPINWASVDQAIGRTGAEQPGGVHKYSFPRSDIHVTLDGVAIKPALALGGWIAFEPMQSGAMFMGDLVLTDREVSPVMKRLIEGGVEITAVHNHLFRTSIPVFYMHVEGRGDPVKLAETLHAALALSRTPLGPSRAARPAPVALEIAELEKALGRKGSISGGVLHFGFPRAETITDGGMPIPSSMGTATSINFQPTGGGKAAITGDFVLLSGEVNPVLKTLRESGIEVTALHSHMIHDSPHLYFMHYWANDDAGKLAQGLRAALDHMNVQHGS